MAATNANEEVNLLKQLLIFQTVFSVFVIVLTEVGNILTLVVFIKHKSLRKKNFLFIPSLAAADALAGLGMAVKFAGFWCTKYLGGTLIVMAPTFGLFLSHLHINAMAVVRFIALTFPFKYHQWMTVKRICITIAVMWISAVVYTLTLLSWGWQDPEDKEICGGHNVPYDYIVWTTFPLFLLTVLTLVVTYTKIFQVATRKAITVDSVSVATVHHRPPSSCTDSEQCHQTPNIGKVSKYIAAVIGAYILTWTMFFGVRIGRVAYPAIADDANYQIIALLSLNIAISNSALDTFIYACFLSEFREAYKSILCCIRKH